MAMYILVSVYQHKTIAEIADMMQANLLTLDDINTYQSWVCREDHFELDEHNAAAEELERRWNANNSDPACDKLCRIPAYIHEDATRSLWSAENAFDIDTALTDGATFKKNIFMMRNLFFHIAIITGTPQILKQENVTLSEDAGRRKGISAKVVPKKKRITLIPKVVCPGNARKYDLRVAGRRNALGSILSRRRCEWLSGAAASFAVIFRHNTHTGPNYRMPLLESTHDPQCKAGCLEKHTNKRMTVAAQRAQRSMTGYYTGYIQKRQPVGKFELKQAALNLQ